MKDLDVFRVALSRGKAIPAWQLAYLLARLSPPSPAHDAPITIPMDERPPLVIAGLQWISDRAAANPVSPEDEARRTRGWVEYFVKSEIAIMMLDQAKRHADPWHAMPHVRAIDAAVLIAGDQPRAGVKWAEDLTPTQLAGARLIHAETGSIVPSKWGPKSSDAETWITNAQLARLVALTSATGDHVVPVKPILSRMDARIDAIRAAAKVLGIDLMALTAVQGKAGEKRRIRDVALDVQKDAFGRGDQNQAFNRAWEKMSRDGEIQYRPS